jgi:hypothetical protein
VQRTNWPWEKASLRKSTPNFSRVCPWDLFIVTPCATLRGNCVRIISMPEFETGNLKGILGIITVSVALGILASMNFRDIFSTITFVPLTNRSSKLMFLINMATQPTFNSKTWSGTPVWVITFSTSVCISVLSTAPAHGGVLSALHRRTTIVHRSRARWCALRAAQANEFPWQHVQYLSTYLFPKCCDWCPTELRGYSIGLDYFKNQRGTRNQSRS